MSKAFVYDWETYGEKMYKAYALDENSNPITLRITGYYPHCYLDISVNTEWVEKMSGVVPVSIEDTRMSSTVDISRKKLYIRTTFETYKDMKLFCKYVSQTKRHMDDVQPVTGFLSKFQFPHVGWFEYQGKSPIHAKNMRVLDKETKITYPKIACIDIETISTTGYGMPKPYRREDAIQMVSVIFKKYLDPNMEKYLVFLGKKDEIKKKKDIRYIFCDTELELIQEMGRLVTEKDPDVITGYNIFGFDVGYIVDRLKLHLKPLPEMSRDSGRTTTYKVNWSSSAYGQNVYDRLQVSGRVFIDMMLFFRRMKLDKYSLDFVSKKYLGVGKMDMDYEVMWGHFLSRNKKGLTKAAEYCVYDSVLTLELFDKFVMWTDVCEMSRAMRCSIEDIYTRGEQLKILNQVIYKCHQRGVVMERRNVRLTGDTDGYKGAYVLEPKKGIFVGCTVLDFQSLYPSVLISYNLCPSTYISPPDRCKDINIIQSSEGKRHMFRKSPIGILPDLAKTLLDERYKVKAEMAQNGYDLVLDKRQNALKICANSIYGITGFQSNKYMGHVQTAESITSTGRKLLETTVEKIGNMFHKDVTVVYGDTDSCMLYHNGCTNRKKNMETANRIVDAINKELPTPLKLLVEKYYEKMAFLSKKRYLMYDGNKVSSKGVASSRRNYCTFTRDLYTKTVEYLLSSSDSPEDILYFVIENIMELMDGKVEMEKLIMTKSTKPVESYKNTNVPHVYMLRRLLSGGDSWEMGNRLEYLFVDIGRKAKLQGERLYTPEEVTKLDLPIDYLYYLEKQVVTVMDELLDIVGYGTYVANFLKKFRQNS
jgi:DNA polymerase elongation subunit (family B)